MVRNVSIIIPCKNRPVLLLETIASIRSQTCTNWEAVVVDDGSNDQTIGQMESVSREDPRIRFLRRNGNFAGANVCRNLGFEASKGEYIIFLDSDDYLAPFCLERRVKTMQDHPGLSFAVFPCRIFREKPGDTDFLWNADSGEDDIDRFLTLDIPWAIHSVIWRRAAFNTLEPWDEAIHYAQDWMHNLRTLTQRIPYRRFSGPDCSYRVPGPKGDSVTSQFNSPAYLHAQESLLRPIRDMLIGSQLFNEKRRRLLAGLHFSLAMRWQCECGSTSEAFRVWEICRENGLVDFIEYWQGWAFLRSKDLPVVWRARKYSGQVFRNRYAVFRGSTTIYRAPSVVKSERLPDARTELRNAPER